MITGPISKLMSKVCLGVFVIIACSLGLACFFAAKSTETCPHSTDGMRALNRSIHGCVIMPHSFKSTPAAVEEDDQSATPPPAPSGAATNPTENAGAEGLTEDEEPTSEEIASFKEKLIREKFGVVRRDGKWIPTIGGGTKLVYITTGSIPTGKVGELYEVQFMATSGCPPYRWSIVRGKLPKLLLLDSYSGKLSGIPTEPATVDFFLEVTDCLGAKDVAEYILTLQPEKSLEIATKSLPGAIPGEDYTFQLQAVGGAPPYAWSVEAQNLDEIGTLILNPQTGELDGEIIADCPPIDIPLVFWLSDAQVHVSKELVLHVRNTLSILDVPQSPVRASEPFEFSFKATGGVEPYLWGISGNLPPGLEFSATGLCSGTPSESGTYEISVCVQDAAGFLDTVQFTLDVLPVPESVANFRALLSRNSVALKWDMPAVNKNLSVRIVRSSTGNPLTMSDGRTVYHGTETSYLDRDVGMGAHYYTAFLESNGTTATSVPPPTLCATLPPVTDPFADGVVSKHLLHPNAFGAERLPDIVLGAPRGKGLAWGSTDVASLGAAIDDDGGVSAPYGGTITLEFVDNEVWDGPGADLTVFENVFYVCNEANVPDPETRFMEPAVISVSQDGMNWRQFKTNFSPRYDPASGMLNLRHPYCYNSGFAGVNPVMSDGYDPDPTDTAMSGGDSFDIAAVGLEWIRYVRIQSTGSRWFIDDDGDLVYHNEETGAASRINNKAGFDLDAVTAIWMKQVVSQ